MSVEENSKVDGYLSEIRARVLQVLGGELVGVYLTGSLALGAYLEGRSDIDVTVVAAGPTARSRLERLVDSLAHPHLPCPAPKLELVVYPRGALRGDHLTLRWSLNLNTGPEVGLVASYEATTEPAHWFVLDVAMARRHARPLLGPAPSHVFGEIEHRRILAALLESLRWHDNHDGAGVQAVLNACRALRFVIDGVWVSKEDAALWVQSHASDPGLVTAALSNRRSGQRTAIDRAAVLAFVRLVRSHIERAQNEV